jgi:protein-S-isoprenylcysteine O-methyltransferase Ste14
MVPLIIFGVLSFIIIFVSRKPLRSLNAHGVYRFVSWECIAWLLVCNVPYWFSNILGIWQLISWSFLFYASYLVIAGIVEMKHAGGTDTSREEHLFEFEKTSELVTSGIFKYVRHPLYASLVFLTWAICLKKPDWILVAISGVSTVFLFLTAWVEEKENITYFGAKYKDYMKHTKMFIPFVF